MYFSAHGEPQERVSFYISVCRNACKYRTQKTNVYLTIRSFEAHTDQNYWWYFLHCHTFSHSPQKRFQTLPSSFFWALYGDRKLSLLLARRVLVHPQVLSITKINACPLFNTQIFSLSKLWHIVQEIETLVVEKMVLLEGCKTSCQM